MNRRTIILVWMTLTLSACGFKPVYEASGSTETLMASLSAVEIAPVPDRLGQIFTNHLIDRIGGGASPTHRLVVTLKETTRGFGVRSDASVAQEELNVTATMRLVDMDGETVVEESIRARSAYDVVLSDFANVQQREDTARRLVLDIATRIERRLVLYFSADQES